MAKLGPADLAPGRVAIGHLDTGVDDTHPALAGKVSGFLHVDEAGVPEPLRAACDSGTHGTHTAGIAAGIATAARFYCASVIEGGKTPLRILVGLEWLLAQPIRVLMLPLGVRTDTPFLMDVLDVFRDQGVLPIAAVGNQGSSRYQSPGGYARVLSVGACDAAGEPARFSGSCYAPGSERCEKPDVLAPGIDVLSAAPGGRLRAESGTSMACAYVAGVAAAIWGEHPGASVDAIEAAIVESAAAPLEAWRHRSRAGIIRPGAALDQLLRGRGEGGAPRVDRRRSQAKFVDPRLARKLTFSFDDAELEALLVLDRAARADGEDRPLERLVERYARALGSPPALVRTFHRGSICQVRGQVRLLATLIADPSVAVAQSTEVDAI